MNKRTKIIIILLSILLIISNFLWYKLYTREQNLIRHAIIPNNANDFFTKQKILTNYQIQTEKFLSNPLGIIAELEFSSRPLPYNIYFKTEDDFHNYIEEYKNQKNAPLIQQNPDYPNGCESASAVMLLNSIGIDLSLQEFIENYLDKEDVYENKGERFGPDPSTHYAGDPASNNRGWGALEPVIVNSLERIILEKNKSFFENHYLFTSQYKKAPLYLIAANKYPTIIWITQDYTEANEVYEWISNDKKSTYTYPKKSHTVLLTGFDENYYYINDPLKDEKNIKVPREQLEKSFDSMGRQFISIT